MKKKSFVRDAIEELLRANGFKRIGAHWVRDAGTCFQMAHIQGSHYGTYYFLNLGIRYKAIDGDDAPKKTEGSHLEFRPGDTQSQLKGQVADMLNEDIQRPIESRIKFMEGPMWADAERVFAEFATLEAACSYAQLPQSSRPPGGPSVHRRLLEFCGVEVPNLDY